MNDLLVESIKDLKRRINLLSESDHSLLIYRDRFKVFISDGYRKQEESSYAYTHNKKVGMSSKEYWDTNIADFVHNFQRTCDRYTYPVEDMYKSLKGDEFKDVEIAYLQKGVAKHYSNSNFLKAIIKTTNNKRYLIIGSGSSETLYIDYTFEIENKRFNSWNDLDKIPYGIEDTAGLMRQQEEYIKSLVKKNFGDDFDDEEWEVNSKVLNSDKF
jgi:hypothetical protein